MKSLFLFILLIHSIFSYNPDLAVDYARQWYNRRNPIYTDYSGMGGDCANFVSQCLIAGGFSTSGCYGNWGTGSTIPLVTNLETCLVNKGWKKSYSIPSGGFPKGGVIAFNNGQHTVLCVQGGNNPLVAGHTDDEWMAGSNWGTRTYYWDPNANTDIKPVDPDKPTNINWFPVVSGYNINDYYNGFAGDYGKAMVGLKINQGTYSVHEKGGKWYTSSNNNVAGRGYPIDAVAIKGGINYRVHILGGNWLPAVNGYDFNEGNNGYAGIMGRTIDAIAIQGRTYCSGY